VDGILGHNLLLSLAFSYAFIYQEAFLANFFLFSRWNSAYHEAFLTNFFSFFMKTFSRTFFFFLNGILAVTKPFSRTFFFFLMEFWLSRSLSHVLFYFFLDGILDIRNLGEDSFIHYHKEYLHRICLVKNLAS
jgi:hypothetical protein